MSSVLTRMELDVSTETTTPAPKREHFARAALAAIPKLLTLQDRDPHSPTFGCFDRNYWHYKIIDFPSGMAEELVWPLALAFDTPLVGNRFHAQPAVREAVIAGLAFGARSARKDGSVDDYFPFERAAGAAAFSLVAGLEAARIVGVAGDRQLTEHLARRADWLAAHRESGRLANHEALIALGLELAGGFFGSDRWRRAAGERLERVLSWQDPEGWFWEYEGCDPGYLTLTIGALASLEALRPDPRLRGALERAVRFAAELVFPDGSFGGELGSRNTYAFFPHGFELVGRWMPEALAVNDRILGAMAQGKVACFEDDHLAGHHPWSQLLAHRHWVPVRPRSRPRPDGRRYFPSAGLLVDRRRGSELYVALHAGGAFKLFRDGALIASDTGVSLRVGQRNAVAHLRDRYATTLEQDLICVEGRLGWAKRTQMTPGRLLLLRGCMLTVGRFASDWVRRLLQRLLIVGKAPAPFELERRFSWRGGRWWVRDEVRAERWDEVDAAGIGGHQTSIHVVMSRTFHPSQLQPWLDLGERVAGLGPGEPLVVERIL